jgi:cell division protein ZapA
VANVKIYDREYALRSTGDAARVQLVAAHVDSRMREIAGESGAVDTLKVAILAALSLADDLFRTQEELRKLDETVSRRARECSSILDQVLR